MMTKKQTAGYICLPKVLAFYCCWHLKAAVELCNSTEVFYVKDDELKAQEIALDELQQKPAVEDSDDDGDGDQMNDEEHNELFTEIYMELKGGEVIIVCHYYCFNHELDSEVSITR
jgi:hypothetical protein